MQYEVEQKFAVSELEPVREGLVALGGTLASPCTQSDRYLAHPCKDFAETDEAFRIRTVGEACYVTYKGPRQDTAIKTRREVELPLGSGADVPEHFTELFTLLGFTQVREVCKQRTTTSVMWEGTRVAAMIDEVDRLGTFVELEICVSESETAQAKVTIDRLAQHLGLENVEPRSYLEMLLAVDKL